MRAHNFIYYVGHDHVDVINSISPRLAVFPLFHDYITQDEGLHILHYKQYTFYAPIRLCSSNKFNGNINKYRC